MWWTWPRRAARAARVRVHGPRCSAGRALDLLLAADKYALDGLRVAASRECVAALSIASVTEAFSVADSLDLAPLKSAALLFVSNNLRQVEEHRATCNNSSTTNTARPTVTECGAPRSNPATPTGTLPMPVDMQAVVSPVAPLAAPPSGAAAAAAGSMAAVASAAVVSCDAEMRDAACSSGSGSSSKRKDHSVDPSASVADDGAVLSAPAPLADSEQQQQQQQRKRVHVGTSPTTPFSLHTQLDSRS